jgi:hypothetical protein
MAIISVNVDTKLVVDNTNDQGPLIGTLSNYVDNIHPGSGQKISGWQFDNRRWPAEDSDYTSAVTGLTNPDLSQINSINFQSGIGSNEDCVIEDLSEQLNIGFIENWIPRVNHGRWFDHEKEYYLYADATRSQYAKFADVVSGSSFIDMVEFPKDAVPILCRTYLWDATTEQYLVYKNYNRKVYFTGTKATPTSPRLSTWNNNSQQIIFGNIDTTKNEFLLLYAGHTIPRIVFNKNVLTTIGHAVVSGADLLSFEEVGIGDGSIKLLFHTKYSPMDKTQTAEVYTYTTDINVYQQWTTRLNTSLVHSGHECIIDTDLGTIQFGDTADSDVIPPNNAHVLIRYTYTTEALYETTDSDGIFTATNKSADANPFSRTNDRGFIIINRTEITPASILLEAETTLISSNVYGPIDIGNVLIPIKATVLSKSGLPIEHIKVNFTILDTPLIGHFTNGVGGVSTFTNNLGVARSYYDTPNSIDDVSEFIPIAQYSTSGGNTILNPLNIKVTSTQRDVYIYSVWKDDPFQGIFIGSQVDLDAGLLTPELDEWYEDFFNADVITGPTGVDPTTFETEGALQTGASWWENRRRLLQHIITPTSYNRALRNGRKQIVATWDSTALDPHFNEVGAFVPLKPTTITNMGPTDNDVQYNGIVLTAPGTGDLDGYLLISPTEVLLQATVVDEFLNKTIYSNVITIKLKISNALNGTVYVDDFNAIPPNTVPYVLNSGDNGKILPLGFKIRRTGNTLASAIQRVTYIDINQPAILTMTFNVDKIT